MEVTVIRPVTVSVLEGIALLQQTTEGQIGHLFIGNRHLTNSALRRTGVLDRRFGIHAQCIDAVTVQIKDERIIDHHCRSGHVRQQLQCAAVVFGRVNERIGEAREILCVRTGDIDLCCGFHPTGGAGILRHGFSIRRAVIADLLADGAFAVFPLVLARAYGHFVCCLGLVAQVERGVIIPKLAVIVQIVGKMLAAILCFDAVVVSALLERTTFQHGVAICF